MGRNGGRNCAAPVVPAPEARIRAAARALGLEVASAEPLAGDASTRRFFRLTTAAGGTLVAAVYPPGAEAEADRHVRVQRWGLARGLPIPALTGAHGGVVVSQDAGRDDLEAVRARGDAGPGLEAALGVLAAFQACRWEDCPNPRFDAEFFRRELDGFEDAYLGPDGGTDADTAAFLDVLAGRLEEHPFRLAHRDFHANNLIVEGERMLAVDYQDMRGGPDTYDVVSLLRERGGAGIGASEGAWVATAAARLGWDAGWQERYRECAAQRGLKVLGTFARLTAAGRPGYGRWIAPVRRGLAAVLPGLAPGGEALAARLASAHPYEPV